MHTKDIGISQDLSYLSCIRLQLRVFTCVFLCVFCTSIGVKFMTMKVFLLFFIV